MGKKKYEGLPELLEGLQKTCAGLTVGIRGFSQGTKASRDEMKSRSFLMRSFAQKDFESNTGMGLDEWVEFSERLLSRFESISAAVQRLDEVKLDPSRVPSVLKELRDVASPFLERYDLIIEALDRFANYMLDMPKKAESIPKAFRAFMGEEDRKRMVEEAPKAGEGIKGLITELKTVKEQITDLNRFL